MPPCSASQPFHPTGNAGGARADLSLYRLIRVVVGLTQKRVSELPFVYERANRRIDSGIRRDLALLSATLLLGVSLVSFPSGDAERGIRATVILAWHTRF